MPDLMFIQDLKEDSKLLTPCHGRGLTAKYLPDQGAIRLQCLICGKHVADIAVAYHENGVV